jgi:hypothetical protein
VLPGAARRPEPGVVGDVDDQGRAKSGGDHTFAGEAGIEALVADQGLEGWDACQP